MKFQVITTNRYLRSLSTEALAKASIGDTEFAKAAVKEIKRRERKRAKRKSSSAVA